MSLVSILKKHINKVLFTTPSHNRKFFILHKFYNWYRSDISEIDVLDPQKELKLSEENAAKIYETKYTKYLTNGSTSGIMSAVLTCAYQKKILLWDKAHISHKNSAEIACCTIIEYEQEYNSEWGVYLPLSPQTTEKLIKHYKPDVLLMTSPSYEGFCADIKQISKICKINNVKLIVDEAHGALYPFSDKLPTSAVKYADYTVQSLHKTAGGLNPTALIHSNDEDISFALQKISTTSPSYPLLASIEANIKYLNSKRGRAEIDKLITNIQGVRNRVDNISFGGDDCTKLLIKKNDLSGYELSEILYNKYNIEDERTNKVSTLLLTGIGTSNNQIKRLEKVLKFI